MPATAVKRKAIHDALLMNDRSRELSQAVEELRGADEFASLVSYADDFGAEVRARVRKLIRNCPEAHGRVLYVLRTALQMVEADRAELKEQTAKLAGLRIVSRDVEKLRDLDCLETYVRSLAREIVTAH